MKILVACEYSGRVREAFRQKGHYAISADLLPSALPGPHYQGDYRHLIDQESWDMLIAFPPCTHLCTSGARWFHLKEQQQHDAIRFVEEIWALPIPRIAIENPIGILSTRSQLGKPTQIIQPWMFGETEQKATCLWLKNLPQLSPTQIMEERHQTLWQLAPGPDRAKRRSLTFQGIANAMATQWPGYTQHQLF